jgi:hypothetical protein
VLTRTDRAVEALARHVLDAALDPALEPGARPAARAGVVRTRAVNTRTTLLLARFRFHLDLPLPDRTSPGRRGPDAEGGPRVRQLVAEDARLLAFRGGADQAVWLDEDEVQDLLAATPDANVPADQARDLMTRTLEKAPALQPALAARADELAAELLATHRRVRAGAGAARRGLKVIAQHPVDVLGVYVFLPVHTTGGAA